MDYISTGFYLWVIVSFLYFCIRGVKDIKNITIVDDTVDIFLFTILFILILAILLIVAWPITIAVSIALTINHFNIPTKIKDYILKRFS